MRVWVTCRFAALVEMANPFFRDTHLFDSGVGLFLT